MNKWYMILLRNRGYFEDEEERSSSWLFTGIDALSCLQTSLSIPHNLWIFQERHNLCSLKRQKSDNNSFKKQCTFTRHLLTSLINFHINTCDQIPEQTPSASRPPRKKERSLARETQS